MRRIRFQSLLVALAYLQALCGIAGAGTAAMLSPAIQCNTGQMNDIFSGRQDSTLDLFNRQLMPHEVTELFINDLGSRDAEVRLQAAIALRERGIEHPKIERIIIESANKESQIGRYLTLAQRVQAAHYLAEKEKQQMGLALGFDAEHYARIDAFGREVFSSGESVFCTPDALVKLAAGMDNVEEAERGRMMGWINRLEWPDAELRKTLQGVSFFNGGYEEVLRESLIEECDVPAAVVDQFMAAYVPGEIFFDAFLFLRANVLAQQTIQQLRARGAIILEGDREWFVLNAFKRLYFSSGRPDEVDIMEALQHCWQESSAVTRIVDIFSCLDALGLYVKQVDSEVRLEAILQVAGQFISRAYNDSNGPEYAPGPCYDARKVTIGIEYDRSEGTLDSVHVNLGVSWTSKYIWAVYLALDAAMDNRMFTGFYFDYFYSQLIDPVNSINGLDRRQSYIGVWVKTIFESVAMMDRFILFSKSLDSFMDQTDPELAAIWYEFRTRFERIILAQHDEQLNEEFFVKARMVRFEELVSAQKRNNDFYRSIKALIDEISVKLERQLQPNAVQALEPELVILGLIEPAPVDARRSDIDGYLATVETSI